MKDAKHGGRRTGAGRPPIGRQTVRVMFSLPRQTVELLSSVPSGERSRFVDTVILAALKRRRRKELAA
jgi:hypothetical protein